MALTALRINGTNAVVITTQYDVGTLIQFYAADGEFIPMGEPDDFGTKISEEEWQTNFRKEAAAKGHYVKEHSTNPEWNPDYNPEEHEQLLSSMQGCEQPSKRNSDEQVAQAE